MKIQRAHVVKLNPNREQEQYFLRACGCRRFVYNWAVSQWEAWWALYGKDLKRPSAFDLDKYFNRIKDTICPWIREVSNRIPTRAIRDAGNAYGHWFKAIKRGDTQWGRAKRAKRGMHERFYVHNGSLRFNDRSVFIEKLGWVRCREEFRFEDAKILAGSVQKKADGWYLALQVELEIDEPDKHAGDPVGIDAGIAQNFTLSTGEVFDLPRKKLADIQKRIARQQRVMSRRWSGRAKKGHETSALRNEQGQLLPKSNRFRKASEKLSKLYLKQARIREQALHYISREIIEKHSKICIEDLQLRNMTKSAKGDEETPGKNVSAKAGLNRSILNVAIREFRWMLEYKSPETGASVVPVPAQYTSQTCSKCGCTDEKNRKTQANFLCVKCGFECNADINAARNILEKGLQT